MRTKVEYVEDGVVFNVVDEAGKIQHHKEFRLDTIPETQQQYLKLYGFNKLLSDRTSEFSKNHAERLEKMEEVVALLASDQWRSGSRASTSGTVSPEVEALAELKGVTIPEIQKALKQYSKEQREKILANDKVAEKAERIRQERQESEGVSLDDLA